MSRHRAVALVLLALVLAPVLVGVSAAPVAAQADGNETATPTPDDNTGPTLAEQTRISAASFGAEYARVEAVDAGQQFNVTGRVAVLTSSENVQAARLDQPGGEAAVLDGQRTIKLEWQADASPDDANSFYALTLFYADNSTRTVDLYVSNTNQAVVDGKLAEAGPLLDELESDAEDHGFATTLDGIERYHDWERQQADFFDGWLQSDLEAVKGWVIITASTGLILVLLGAYAIFTTRKQRKRHGRKIRSLKEAALTELRRRKLINAYREDEQRAAESRLEDVDRIGTAYIHYAEQLGVHTERQLGDLLARGKPLVDADGQLVRHDPDQEGVEPVRDHNGDVVTNDRGDPLGPIVTEHDGIADIERALEQGDALYDTWLEPIIRDEHLGSAERFLSESSYVLQRLSERHGLPKYRETERRTKRALDHLRSGTGQLRNPTSQETGYVTASGVTGDD